MSRMSAGNSFQASGAAVENDLDTKAVRERGIHERWMQFFSLIECKITSHVLLL